MNPVRFSHIWHRIPTMLPSSRRRITPSFLLILFPLRNPLNLPVFTRFMILRTPFPGLSGRSQTAAFSVIFPHFPALLPCITATRPIPDTSSTASTDMKGRALKTWSPVISTRQIISGRILRIILWWLPEIPPISWKPQRTGSWSSRFLPRKRQTP